MRAVTILQRLFGDLTEIHQARRNCIFKVVEGVLAGRSAALTTIGRALRGPSETKHQIKLVDRLFGNARLQAELGLFYGRIIRDCVPRNGRPVLLVDWTARHGWSTLKVTLVTSGRGVVIYEDVHPSRRENNPRVEAKCLHALKQQLPDDCRPIVVADAGFRGPWMRCVRKQGWDFVCRVRGRVNLRRNGDTWRPAKALWNTASNTAADVGICEVSRTSPVACRIVTLWERRRRTVVRPLPAVGRRKKKRIKAAREPWVLATSLDALSASQVARLYRLRMRIEETFRDQKCRRLGLALDDVRTRKIERLRTILMLVTLAHYVAMLAGEMAERLGLASAFQANTVRRRRVLSLARLGREVLARQNLPPDLPLPRLAITVLEEIEGIR